MTRLDARQFDLLAIAVLAPLLTHVTHLPIWLSVTLVVALALRWAQRHWRPQSGRVPIYIRLPLTLVLPVLVIGEYGNLFGREPGSALGIGLLVLKLGETETPRDARAVVTFACFTLMAALLFRQDLGWTALVGVALVPQLLVLRSLEPRRTDPVDGARAGLPLRRSIAGALASLLAAVPLALIAFLFLPRLSAPLWGAPRNDQARTGVSDQMSPGSMTDLLIDEAPAFRVVFDSEPPLPSMRYWRGLVLSQFDGANWTRADAPPISPGAVIPMRPAVAYEITLEPTSQPWLFTLDRPLERIDDALLANDLSLMQRLPITEIRRYRLRSDPAARFVALTARQRRQSLALPPGFNPRTQALASQWRALHAEDSAVIQAALKYFNDSFHYTLSPPLLGRDSMDDFLFETQAGYCEHYSAAFTVLMRAAGIPARVVVGYQGGYWNELGNYMIVRQSDAHAWSEVWLADRGWVRVDPTAAVSPERVELGSRSVNSSAMPWYSAEWLLGLRNRWDLVNRWWNDAVVRFDTIRQHGLLSRFGMTRPSTRDVVLLFAVSCSAVLLVGLAWALRRRRPSGDALDRAYARLCRRLAALGATRAPQLGPLEYAGIVEKRLPAQSAADARTLLQHYARLRYASRTPDRGGVDAFITDVGRWSRRQPGRWSAMRRNR